MLLNEHLNVNFPGHELTFQDTHVTRCPVIEMCPEDVGSVRWLSNSVV